jgi:hypothetical protein
VDRATKGTAAALRRGVGARVRLAPVHGVEGFQVRVARGNRQTERRDAAFHSEENSRENMTVLWNYLREFRFQLLKHGA